jgi:LDH2 family malate/lactate/ureidoglycolate dehydrogenase
MRPDVAAVRMPGDTALARRRAQLATGIELNPSIMPSMTTWADKLGVVVPSAGQ